MAANNKHDSSKSCNPRVQIVVMIYQVLYQLVQRLFVLTACFIMACSARETESYETRPAASVYHIDADNGNDKAAGTTAQAAWKSLNKLKTVKLIPGDTIKFKRGSAFTGPLFINESGTARQPIVLTAYGEGNAAPAFTNPVFEQDNFGNCIRIKGSYVIVENLFFHKTAAHKPGNYKTDGGWDVWEMGAVYLDKTAKYCIVRNNEMEDCVVGIKSYGPYAVIENNYIHDCNRVLKEWGWGPIGIWFGADHQEARFNRIFNYRAEDPNIHWEGGVGGGADGGAFEIDDARYNKSDIHIHHNYTRDCQGFLEVTWTDVKQHPDYRDFKIHHNLSDDYQQFTAIWQGENFSIDHNTIIRRKVNVNDWGVFNITGNDSKNKIRNNIIITEKDIPVFNTGLRGVHTPNNIISHNLYYAASGNLVIGKEGPGTAAVYGNPQLKKYVMAAIPEHFDLLENSMAIDKAVDLGYTKDFKNSAIPAGAMPDIGAFEKQ